MNWLSSVTGRHLRALSDPTPGLGGTEYRMVTSAGMVYEAVTT
jgi:hypothetical protein